MSIQLDFFETVPEPEAARYEANNQTQNAIILRIFQREPHREFTPFDIYNELYEIADWPITSVRRAINNLERQGFIKKSGIGTGIYGHRNYTWKLA